MKKTSSLAPLPPAFAERIRMQYPDDAEALLCSLERPPVPSVQLHPFKHHQRFYDAPAVPWYAAGRMLESRPSFTFDPFFHSGAYYPQESSSMFIGWLLAQYAGGRKDLKVLDLCASPGGKSLLLLNALGPGGTLIANEIHPERNAVLRQNLMRWGIPRYIVTRAEARQFADAGITFDVVLTDAPCSGEGMFRKDPQARTEWSTQQVLACARRQSDILQDALYLLREGGLLVYSTCTFSPEENEEQCRFIGSNPLFEPFRPGCPDSFPVRVLDEDRFHGYAFLPHIAPGEGFFASAFIFRGSTENPRTDQRRLNHASAIPPPPGFSVSPGDDLMWSEGTQGQRYISPFSTAEIEELSRHVRVTSPGHPAGIDKDKKLFIPHHGLSMIQSMADTQPSVQADEETALRYLRGHALAQLPDAPLGWVIIRYKEAALGWVKNVNGRANNLYPDALRIRT